MFGIAERFKPLTGASLRWREDPAVMKLAAHKVASDRLAKAYADRAQHARDKADVAAWVLADAERRGQWARVRDLQAAYDLAMKEAREERDALLACEGKLGGADLALVHAAMEKTALAIVVGSNQVAQELAALVEEVLAKSAELDRWTALEDENYRSGTDAVAGVVSGIRCYLPNDAPPTFVPLNQYQQPNVSALLAEWLGKMKERGFKVKAL